MNLRQTAKILELYTHFYKFQKGYQPITKSVEYEKDVQLAGTHFE
jgi:hypothetical protein